MNIFVQQLAEGDLDNDPPNQRLVVEDNVGESIHLHYREFRLEMTVKDFRTFASHVEEAREELASNDGH